MNRSEMKQKFFDALNNLGKPVVTRAEVKQICSQIGLKGAQFFTKEDQNRAGRGLYHVPNAVCNMQAKVISMPINTEKNKIASVATDLDATNLVPSQYKNYVPFGNFSDVLAIVEIGRAHV